MFSDVFIGFGAMFSDLLIGLGAMFSDVDTTIRAMIALHLLARASASNATRARNHAHTHARTRTHTHTQAPIRHCQLAFTTVRTMLGLGLGLRAFRFQRSTPLQALHPTGGFALHRWGRDRPHRGMWGCWKVEQEDQKPKSQRYHL